jgi:hypothetical protein
MWSALPKHVEFIDGRMKFVVVDGRTCVGYNVMYHSGVYSTKIDTLSDVREVLCYIFKCLRADEVEMQLCSDLGYALS